MLINHGSISTKSVIDAFKAVDRGFFINAPSDARAGEEVRFLNTCAARPAQTPWIFLPSALSLAHRYAQKICTAHHRRPFRNGIQHLSAPGIYGTAIEALELCEGQSFLNVCSGTGYFSAVCAHILGATAIHAAVELRAELVQHARAKVRAFFLTQRFFFRPSSVRVAGMPVSRSSSPPRRTARRPRLRQRRRPPRLMPRHRPFELDAIPTDLCGCGC